MTIPTLISKKKAAAALDVSERTIDRLRGRGEIRFVRIGGQIRIVEASVESYVQNQLAADVDSSLDDDYPIPVLVAMRDRKAA